MNKTTFQSEMRRAETLRTLTTVPKMREYYTGYIKGLRKAYHGEVFGDKKEHDLLLKAVHSRDEVRRQLGYGYNDALALSSREMSVGRPSIGTETLPKIKVPKVLKEGLLKKAEENNLSPADARRKAYTSYIES
jgi:hypothetical protein